MARRRRRSSRSIWVLGLFASAACVAAYSWLLSPVLEGPAEPTKVASLTTDRPQTPEPQDSIAKEMPEKGEMTEVRDTKSSDPTKANRAAALFAAGMQAYDREDLVSARANLSEAVQLGLKRDQLIDARATLSVIGEKTILGPSFDKDDPFVARHVVASGESLGKIAKKYNVTDDFLAKINGIKNKNMIRAGQRLKVVEGPFHLFVDKETYSLDVYLKNTFIKHFDVGLGVDDSTPSGEWVVANKLNNPTYYPPRGGKIIPAGDPSNPLGERWIGLKGVSGDALGQQRYGIHGTIEPDSIGRSSSLGCIRMHNTDVAELYDLVTAGKTKVTVD